MNLLLAGPMGSRLSHNRAPLFKTALAGRVVRRAGEGRLGLALARPRLGIFDSRNSWVSPGRVNEALTIVVGRESLLEAASAPPRELSPSRAVA